MGAAKETKTKTETDGLRLWGAEVGVDVRVGPGLDVRGELEEVV